MSIHGLILEVRVTGCRKLRDTEFFTRQDPYVVLEYATTKLRTRTCTDGGRNSSFDEKFHIALIEGLRELNVYVWNSNTLNHDDFIGSGRVHLHKVLTQGYDDCSWPLQTHHMRSAGEVKLIMHFDVSAMKKMGKSVATSSMHSVPPPPMPTLALHIHLFQHILQHLRTQLIQLRAIHHTKVQNMHHLRSNYAHQWDILLRRTHHSHMSKRTHHSHMGTLHSNHTHPRWQHSPPIHLSILCSTLPWNLPTKTLLI